MTDATYKTGQSLRFREFKQDDYYGFGGAEEQPGMPPMIADNLDENMAIITWNTIEIHNADGKIYSKTIGGFYSYKEALEHLKDYTDDMITQDWLDRNGFNHIADAY